MHMFTWYSLIRRYVLNRNMKKPRICIVFAGGTIGMVRDSKAKVLVPAKSIKSLIPYVPHLSKYIRADFKKVANIDSSNMQPHHWSEIARTIDKLYDKYDGFVVAQGTDTMAYTASALSFALQNLGKPVVLTGSLIPLSELGSDAANNLSYACMVATMDLAEVCIAFGSRIMRGNRAKKSREVYSNVFHSPNFPLLGEVSHEIKLFGRHNKRNNRKKLKCSPLFNNNIVVIKLIPGFRPDYLQAMMESNIDGIIFEAFGPGNMPFMEESLMPFLAWCRKKKIPVVVLSQMEHGVTDFTAYEAGDQVRKNGAISGGDMTIEACTTKFMHCLASKKKISEARKCMETDIAGELGKRH